MIRQSWKKSSRWWLIEWSWSDCWQCSGVEEEELNRGEEPLAKKYGRGRPRWRKEEGGKDWEMVEEGK
jgi:hypothetical protein